MVSGRNGDYSVPPTREPDILVILVQENPSNNQQLPTYLVRLIQGGSTSFTRIIPFSRLRQIVQPSVYKSVSSIASGEDEKEPIFECNSTGNILRRLHFEEDSAYQELNMQSILYRVARKRAEEKQRQFGSTTSLEDRTSFAKILASTN